MPSKTNSGSTTSESNNNNDTNATSTGGAEKIATAKRGGRACAVCRKGKNRCEGWENPPCKRCRIAGTACYFEKPVKEPSSFDLASLERIASLESQMVNMSSSLNELISIFRTVPPTPLPTPLPAAPPQAHPSHHPGLYNTTPYQTVTYPSGSRDLLAYPEGRHIPMPSGLPLGVGANPFQALATPQSTTSRLPMHPTPPQAANIPLPPSSNSSSRNGTMRNQTKKRSLDFDSGSRNGNGKRVRLNDAISVVPGVSPQETQFPKLPKYASPNHALAHYGLTAPPSPTLSDSDLPSSTLTAPFEALATAAATAAEAEDGTNSVPVSTPNAQLYNALKKIKRRRCGRRRVPPPPNAFPDVVQKGLVSDEEARELFSCYVQSCHPFCPLLDSTFDTYDEFKGRTQFCLDAVLSVAARVGYVQGVTSGEVMRSTCEEAHGIARSTLFAATVRIEAVQAVTVLAAWSDKGYLASGLAVRMALELGLNRALEKLEEASKERSEAENRDLVVSARTWLIIYHLDYVMSVGNARPVLLLSPNLPTKAFLASEYSTKEDIKLVADVELLSHKTRIGDTIASFGGVVDERALGFVRRTRADLEAWHSRWDGELGKHFGPESFQRLSLKFTLHQAIIYLCCTALKGRGASTTSPHPIEVRELALEARAAALASLHILLHTPYRTFLKFGTHMTFVESAFSALFLLKMSKLFPDGTDVDITKEVREVDALAEELKNCPGAQRFAWTLKIATRKWKEENLRFGNPEQYSVDDIQRNMTFDSSSALQMDWAGQAESPTDSLEIYNLLSSILGQQEEQSNTGENLPDIYTTSQLQVPGWMTQQTTTSTFDFGDLTFPALGVDSMFLPSWFGAQWTGDEEEGHAW